MKNGFTELLFALSKALPVRGPAREKLPRIKYPHYTTGDAQNWTYEYTWEDMDAFAPAKNPLFHETPEKLRDEVYNRVFPYFIEHPEKLLEGGTFKDSTVDDVKVFLDMQYCFQGPPRTLDDQTLRKHWSKKAVFTDSWDDKTEKEVPADELLPGELSAVLFEVGCYTVRSAQRVYRVNKDYSETPASEAELDTYKNQPSGLFQNFDGWLDDLRLVHEISARHHNGPEGEFVLIASARSAHRCYWQESIQAIYTAKENASVPDEYVSLFVYELWMGDSHSADWWYKLDPTERIWKLDLGGWDDNDDARFSVMNEPMVRLSVPEIQK